MSPFCYGTTFGTGIYEVSAKNEKFCPGGEETGRKGSLHGHGRAACAPAYMLAEQGGRYHGRAVFFDQPFLAFADGHLLCLPAGLHPSEPYENAPLEAGALYQPICGAHLRPQRGCGAAKAFGKPARPGLPRRAGFVCGGGQLYRRHRPPGPQGRGHRVRAARPDPGGQGLRAGFSFAPHLGRGQALRRLHPL